MDREPFAQFEEYHEGYELSGMLLGGVCFVELPMGAPGDIEIIDKTNAAHETRVKAATSELADPARILAWVTDKNRKPAITAFTEGPERQIAYAFEILAREAVEEFRERAGQCVADTDFGSKHCCEDCPCGYWASEVSAMVRQLPTEPEGK